MNPDQMIQEMLRLSHLLDDSLGYLRRMAQEYAEAEDGYRVAKATALLNAPEGTVSERQAHADLRTSKERQRAYLADGMKTAALEAVRSRRGQLSALQTIANAYRAEAEFARTAPRGMEDRDG